MLTVGTKANYRVQLRRLWEVYKLMPEDDSRKLPLWAQILRYCAKLEYDSNDLDAILYGVRRGRPPVNPDVTDLEMKVRDGRLTTYYSPEKVLERQQTKEDESQKLLDEIQRLGETLPKNVQRRINKGEPLTDKQAVTVRLAIENSKQDSVVELAHEQLHGGDTDEQQQRDQQDADKPGEARETH